MQQYLSGTVTIQPKIASGKCLTLKQGQLVIYDNRRQPNQIFEIIKTQQGQVYLKSQQNGKVITLKQQADRDGISFTGANFDNKPGQRFRIQEISPGSGDFFIYTFCAKMLDVSECSTKNNTVIHQWVFHGEANQMWNLKKA